MMETSSPKISALILTYNEDPNIERTLESLHWVNEIVVVDSGSTDRTLEILARYSAVKVIHRHFDDHAAQCNFGILHCSNPWILSLDADYILSKELITELQLWKPEHGIQAWYTSFQYVVCGRTLHGTLYPPRAVLFRSGECSYVRDGHAHRLIVSGPTRSFRYRILHDDRKPLERWTADQMRYARREAAKLLYESVGSLRIQDRIRGWIVVAPLLTFFYTYFAKGLWRDGSAGLYYCFQRVFAELLLSLCLLECRLSGASFARRRI